MDTYDQESLFSSTDSTASGASASAKDAFGCCSRYSACSDAKTCLIPHLDYSKNCIYRKSLEQGHIFYGKNADKYNAAVYQSFVDNFSTLSDSAAKLLKDILHYEFIKKRGMNPVMIADSPEIPVLEQSGFLSRIYRPEMVVKKCSVSAMIDACGDMVNVANEWAKSQANPDQWAKRKNVNRNLRGVKIYREELSNWIVHFRPEVMQRLTEGICFVEFDLSKTLELEEFFKDRVYEENYSSDLNTLEKDPRFLKK